MLHLILRYGLFNILVYINFYLTQESSDFMGNLRPKWVEKLADHHFGLS